MRRLLLLVATMFSFAATGQESNVLSEETAPAAVAPATVNDVGAEVGTPGVLFNPVYNVRLDSTPSRFTLAMIGNMAQFSLGGRSLLGYSLEMSAGYALVRKLKANVAIDQALSADGGLSVMYTGLRSYLSYALLGSFYEHQSVLIVNGQPSLDMKTRGGSTLGLDFGFDQYIFNGSTTITPATGFSSALRYERDLWGVRVLAQARYGMLVIASQSGTMMSVGMGLGYRF